MAKTQHSTQLHATSVEIAGKAVLLLGESGSGKSDLALRLIDAGATLIGDDQVVVTNQADELFISPGAKLHGLLEARGIGILRLAHTESVPLALVVMLAKRDEIERMPEPAFFDCLGLQVPLQLLHAFDSSTPAKIRALLQYPPHQDCKALQ